MDSVMRPRSSSREHNTNASVTVAVTAQYHDVDNDMLNCLKTFRNLVFLFKNFATLKTQLNIQQNAAFLLPKQNSITPTTDPWLTVIQQQIEPML